MDCEYYGDVSIAVVIIKPFAFLSCNDSRSRYESNFEIGSHAGISCAQGGVGDANEEWLVGVISVVVSEAQ